MSLMSIWSFNWSVHRIWRNNKAPAGRTCSVCQCVLFSTLNTNWNSLHNLVLDVCCNNTMYYQTKEEALKVMILEAQKKNIIRDNDCSLQACISQGKFLVCDQIFPIPDGKLLLNHIRNVSFTSKDLPNFSTNDNVFANRHSRKRYWRCKVQFWRRWPGTVQCVSVPTEERCKWRQNL